jgi:L-xylulokinase
MKYYLGLDNGGTTTKAALYDEIGHELYVAGCDTETLTPAPGFCERDMDEMWDANCVVVREAITGSGVDPAHIAAVACCGHGKGLYLWGKDDAPVCHGIISTDQRAWQYPEKWKADGTAGKVFEKSCQSILPCQPVSILAWMRDNKPELLPRIKYIFECKDYVRFRLTGEAFAEYTDYSGTNLLNLHTREYDPDLLDLFGLGDLIDCLPPLCEATDLCGAVTKTAATQTGLLAGTPVGGGMFDVDACAIAVGVTDESRVCMIAGTWSINEYIRKLPVLDDNANLNSLYCIPPYYLVEESSPTSAGNNQWFVDNMLPEAKAGAKEQGGSIFKEMDKWVAMLPVPEYCPVFLPFIMASNVHPNAKGSFIGITANHTRAHMAKGLYEGIVFSHRWHLERLLKSKEKPFESIRLAGGIANSDVWVQMFADVCKLPVEIADIGETGALGCAIASAVATGRYKSYAEAVQKMVKIGKRYTPRKEYANIYDRKYAIYLKVICSLDAAWPDIQDYIDHE